MSTKSFGGGSVNMRSAWTVTQKGQKKEAGAPSQGRGRVSIAYDVASLGAKSISSAKVTFNISGASQVQYLYVNGSNFKGKENGSINASLSGLKGSFDVSCSMLAATNTKTAGTNAWYASVTEIKLTINYNTNSTTGGGGGSGGGGSGGGGQQGTAGYNAGAFSQSGIYAGSDEFASPPQAIYIFDIDQNKTYAFDGVVKMSHDLMLKMEEEPDEKKAANFTNNARNEPNKVTIDVIMSDVYTSRNDLTNRNEVRSKSAMEVLSELKQSRRKVEVITTLLTYKNMLLAGISVAQDETTTHHGWQGQLTFVECYESAKTAASGGSTSGSATKDSGITNGRTPSVWVSWVGANAI